MNRICSSSPRTKAAIRDRRLRVYSVEKLEIQVSMNLPAKKHVVCKRQRTASRAERGRVWREIATKHYPPRVLQKAAL
jgi:hypothetical protein